MLDKLMQWLVHSDRSSPDEMDVCEFDCRKTECLQGDWVTCERRLAARREQHPQQDTTAQ